MVEKEIRPTLRSHVSTLHCRPNRILYSRNFEKNPEQVCYFVLIWVSFRLLISNLCDLLDSFVETKHAPVLYHLVLFLRYRFLPSYDVLSIGSLHAAYIRHSFYMIRPISIYQISAFLTRKSAALLENEELQKLLDLLEDNLSPPIEDRMINFEDYLKVLLSYCGDLYC